MKYELYYNVNGENLYTNIKKNINTIEEVEEEAKKHFEKENKKTFNLWSNLYTYYVRKNDVDRGAGTYSLNYYTTCYREHLDCSAGDLEKAIYYLKFAKELLDYDNHTKTDDYLYEKTHFCLTPELTNLRETIAETQEKIYDIMGIIKREKINMQHQELDMITIIKEE